MTIGLIDVDGHNFPNLPIMKLSTWHKRQGHQVEMIMPFNQYDRVYIAKVFTDTPDFMTAIRSKEVIKGGTGYFYPNGGECLPDEIEHIMPDYSLYGITDTAYGFLTRGCPRGCSFCIVAKKEGQKSRKVADLSEFWQGQKNIILMDPNLLAYEDHMDLLRQIVESKAVVDVNQGFDIRLTNDANIEMIRQMKVKALHFAWDLPTEEHWILPKLKHFKAATGIGYRKMMVYVLTNFNTSLEYDLYRIMTLKEIGYSPYVMVYDKANAPRKIKHLQRYVNSNVIFRSKDCPTFERYLERIGYREG